jgi:hypothetical protein
MTAMTEAELSHLTGQKGIAAIPGGLIHTLAGIGATSGAWADSAHALATDLTGLVYLAENGWLPLDTPIRLDAVLTGEEAKSMAMQGVALTAGAIGICNPMLSGLFGLGMIPGAFDVVVGDVSVNISGTIELSFHP